MKLFKKVTAVLLSVMIAMTTMHSFFMNAQADDDPVVVDVNVANKIDVALAIGPTDVDYSKFENDLRAKLYEKTPAVLPEDLYITAAQAVLANTTSAFDWWVYDHTKPATTHYNGVAEISDATHTYVENDAGDDTVGSSRGTINRDPDSETYTPDPNNPDIGSKRHPYQGIERHVIESDNGATMDFYGYSNYAYKDFRYLPNDQATKKVFEFAIQEDQAYDALDGVGFFFNTTITGNYEDKTQTMTGYLLFLEYNTSGKGSGMVIYKFKNVNTYLFHQSMLSIGGATSTYKIKGSPGFTEVARSSIYNSNDTYRRIKLEVYPSYVSAYYNGSKDNAAILTTPIAESAEPVEFTLFNTSTIKKQITLDKEYITVYGFGPMASYSSHTCARPTHLTLQNLSMQVDKVRSLVEVVREPDWHENTLKFLVNLNENKIEDFTDTSITGELLNRLRNDDIYYIGWCKGDNAAPSQAFLTKNNLKGKIVDMDVITDYDDQIQAIADEIYERYWRNNDDNIVLTTDQVVLTVSGAEQTDSSDPVWPNGKWKIVHRTDGFDDAENIHPLSGQYLSDLDIQFNLPGYYDLYYRDQFLKTIIAHRPPVAAFNVDINNGEPEFEDTSFDPDDLTKGSVSSSWSYINLDTDSVPTPGLPTTLTKEETYLVVLTVTDKHGAQSMISKQIRYVEDTTDDGVIHPPFSEFHITPSSILKGVGTQSIFLTNTSYDLQSLPITSTFTLTNGENPVSFNFAEGANDVSALPVGVYTISLVVNNGKYDSVPYIITFSIVADTEAPVATADPAIGSFSTNTPVKITFSDSGGSGLKNQRVIITNSTATPDSSDPGWTLFGVSNSRTVNISTVGTSYIHWEAADNAGNKSTGYFGPYTLDKQVPMLMLTANPASSAIYSEPITLTAKFNTPNTPKPTGTVFFYLSGTLIGNATIANGLAEITYAHTLTPLPVGNVIFRASYLGDTNYNSEDAAINYTINRNDNATVTVGTQTNPTYNGTSFVVENINVTGAKSYKIEYEGRDGTVYTKTTSPPTNAGKYTVIVTTTDPGYIEKSASAPFEIFKANQASLNVTGLNSTIEIDLPQTLTLGTTGGTTNGTVTFVSSDPAIASVSGNALTIHKVGDFTVTAKMAGNNNYNDVSSDAFAVTITDTTVPTGEIEVKGNKWTQFWNTVTFGLFFKNTASVNITADTDNSGGAVTVEYYLSGSELTEAQAKALSASDWKLYTTLSINPANKYIIYARLTDESGNYSIINSKGVVVYSDSAQDTTEVFYEKFSAADKTANVVLNGNTIDKIMNGAQKLISGTDYTVSGGTITIKASFLETLTVDSHTLTVHYNPLGETYVDITGNEAPATTSFKVTVEKAASSVELTATGQAVYGEDVILTATIPTIEDGSVPTGTVTFYIDGTAVTDSSDLSLDSSGTASFTVSGLTAGEHVFKVVYSGDGYYKTSEDDIDEYNIAKADQAALNITELEDFYELEVGQRITLETSGGTTNGAVAFESSDPSTASIEGNILTIHKPGDFTVTAKMEGDSNYNPVSSDAFSVRVKDTQAPTGEISIKENKWTKFWNTVTFGKLFKNTADVIITANDNTGESVTIEYYLSEKELTEAQANALDASNWKAYNSLKLDVNGRYIVYAKLTDNYGNVSIINSAGIIIYSDSAPKTEVIVYEESSSEDKSTTVELNGNTIDKIINGEYTLVEGTDYILDGETIIFKASYLETLNPGDYDFTVLYKPLGEGEESVTPEPTTIKLSIEADPTPVPKTADNSRLGMWMLICFLSMTGLFVIHAGKTRKKIQL